MKLWAKILIAMGLGILAGAFLGEQAVWIKPVGTLFLNLVNMIIVLLVFSSMTVGITRIHDPKKLGRVGLKTLLLYLGTTVASILIGLCFAFYFEPGAASNLKLLSTDVSLTMEQSHSLSEIFLSIIPRNPIAALVSGNVLQIIVFSLFFGIAINFAGEKGRPLLEMIESLADVMYRVTSIVMEFSPFGVFALMAWISGNNR